MPIMSLRHLTMHNYKKVINMVNKLILFCQFSKGLDYYNYNFMEDGRVAQYIHHTCKQRILISVYTEEMVLCTLLYVA